MDAKTQHLLSMFASMEKMLDELPDLIEKKITNLLKFHGKQPLNRSRKDGSVKVMNPTPGNTTPSDLESVVRVGAFDLIASQTLDYNSSSLANFNSNPSELVETQSANIEDTVHTLGNSGGSSSIAGPNTVSSNLIASNPNPVKELGVTMRSIVASDVRIDDPSLLSHALPYRSGPRSSLGPQDIDPILWASQLDQSYFNEFIGLKEKNGNSLGVPDQGIYERERSDPPFSEFSLPTEIPGNQPPISEHEDGLGDSSSIGGIQLRGAAKIPRPLIVGGCKPSSLSRFSLVLLHTQSITYVEIVSGYCGLSSSPPHHTPRSVYPPTVGLQNNDSSYWTSPLGQLFGGGPNNINTTEAALSFDTDRLTTDPPSTFSFSKLTPSLTQFHVTKFSVRYALFPDAVTNGIELSFQSTQQYFFATNAAMEGLGSRAVTIESCLNHKLMNPKDEIEETDDLHFQLELIYPKVGAIVYTLVYVWVDLKVTNDHLLPLEFDRKAYNQMIHANRIADRSIINQQGKVNQRVLQWKDKPPDSSLEDKTF